MMKTIKHILAIMILATGLTASAQTQDNVKPAKPKDAKTMRKARTSEKVKSMPNSKVKSEEKAPANEAIQTDKKEQKSGTVTPVEKQKADKTNEVQKANTDQKGSNDQQKIKQIKRPVKKVESAEKAGK